MKKVNLLLAGLVVLGLSACGGASSEAEADAVTEEVTEEVVEAVEEEVVAEDTVAMGDTAAVEEVMEEEVAE